MPSMMYKNLFTFLLLPISLLAFTACSHEPKKESSDNSQTMTQPNNAPAKKSAMVILKSKSLSKANGTIKITESDQGIRLKGEIKGLDSNSGHALHFHEKGSCSGKDANGAGGHFNPENEKHGSLSSKEHHAGDLGNYFANSDGVIKVDKTFSHLSLIKGEMAVKNRSLVLHAKKDDFKSQPSGAAGQRIACGIVPKIK